jgi:hypothetical protein
LNPFFEQYPRPAPKRRPCLSERSFASQFFDGGAADPTDRRQSFRFGPVLHPLIDRSIDEKLDVRPVFSFAPALAGLRLWLRFNRLCHRRFSISGNIDPKYYVIDVITMVPFVYEELTTCKKIR